MGHVARAEGLWLVRDTFFLIKFGLQQVQGHEAWDPKTTPKETSLLNSRLNPISFEVWFLNLDGVMSRVKTDEN